MKTSNPQTKAAQSLPPAPIENPSVARRLRELNSIEKPARSGKIRLRNTLRLELTTLVNPATRLTFDIPSWVACRSNNLHRPNLVWDWLRNGRWLNDPDHGQFTQERFLAAWAKVMASKDAWKDRDNMITEKISISFRQWEMDSLSAVSEFLGVSGEVILVGVLASESLALGANAGPVWDDMTVLAACQPKGGPA